MNSWRTYKLSNDSFDEDRPYLYSTTVEVWYNSMLFKWGDSQHTVRDSLTTALAYIAKLNVVKCTLNIAKML